MAVDRDRMCAMQIRGRSQKSITVHAVDGRRTPSMLVFETVRRVRTRSIAVDRRRRRVTAVDGRSENATLYVQPFFIILACNRRSDGRTNGWTLVHSINYITTPPTLTFDPDLPKFNYLVPCEDIPTTYRRRRKNDLPPPSVKETIIPLGCTLHTRNVLPTFLATFDVRYCINHVRRCSCLATDVEEKQTELDTEK